MTGLFFTVMEAEGDLMQPFDADDGSLDAAPEDVAPPATPDNTDGSDDTPPELDDSSDMDMGTSDDMSFDDTTESDDMASDDGDSSEETDEEEADKKDTKLSDKANNILNRDLYQKFCDRNKEVEEIIENIRQLVPLLPIDIVKSNDDSINRLKSALLKGQNYVINDFVDADYGENLLFYQKLDSLYVILMNQIDTNLKKIKK